jgi:3'-5' exoribonuclease 1
MGKGGQVLEQFCMNFPEHGIATAPPSPSVSASRADPASVQLNCNSGPGTVASTGTQLYGFGTAIAPASVALWSPSRPTTSPGLSISRPVSPMVLVSNSPDSEPEFGVMGRFNPGIPTSVPLRSRMRHKRNVNSFGVGAVSRVGVAVTAACVS